MSYGLVVYHEGIDKIGHFTYVWGRTALILKDGSCSYWSLQPMLDAGWILIGEL